MRTRYRMPVVRVVQRVKAALLYLTSMHLVICTAKHCSLLQTHSVICDLKGSFYLCHGGRVQSVVCAHVARAGLLTTLNESCCQRLMQA